MSPTKARWLGVSSSGLPAEALQTVPSPRGAKSSPRTARRRDPSNAPGAETKHTTLENTGVVRLQPGTRPCITTGTRDGREQER
jgi:hypothetical protein